jgi:hypothetical protein
VIPTKGLRRIGDTYKGHSDLVQIFRFGCIEFWRVRAQELRRYSSTEIVFLFRGKLLLGGDNLATSGEKSPSLRRVYIARGREGVRADLIEPGVGASKENRATKRECKETRE